MSDLKRVIEAAGVSYDARVILYSDSVVLPAPRAYFTLDYLGHGDQAALLDGGLEKWKREGHPLTMHAPASSQGHFRPHPKPELIVQMDTVKDLSAANILAYAFSS